MNQPESNNRRPRGEDQDSREAGPSLGRYEERLQVTKEQRAHVIRARKHVETQHVDERVPRQVEETEVERVGVGPNDSGEIETLPDGSLSIPVLEEELVVTKRVVTRERLIIRKRQHTEHTRVESELRREVVDLETDVPEAVEADEGLRRPEA